MTYCFRTGLSIIIFLFCSCSGLFSAFDSEEAKENTGFIRVKNAERTILPNTDTSDLTDFVLTGEKKGSTKELANVDSFEELSAETIELECGTWTFTLSAKSKSTNATFSASLEKIMGLILAGMSVQLIINGLEKMGLLHLAQ